MKKVLSLKLPTTFKGFSTHFESFSDCSIGLLSTIQPGQEINHKVVFYDVDTYFKEYLGISSEDIKHLDLPNTNNTIKNWLCIPQQKLLAVTSGKVFHDGLGTLNLLRKKLEYYPEYIWLYLLACQYEKISQESAFIGRAGIVDDYLGSHIITCRIVTYIMELCFFLDKKYFAYSKWFGSAFKKLSCVQQNNLEKKLFEISTSSENWEIKQKLIGDIYKILCLIHNQLFSSDTTSDFGPVQFHSRPFYVPNFPIDSIKQKLLNIELQFQSEKKEDAEKFLLLSKLLEDQTTRVGNVDQICDSIPIKENPIKFFQLHDALCKHSI